MKKIISISFLCLLGITLSLSAATVYENELRAALSKLDAAVSVSDYKQCRETFRQLSIKNPKEWLPVYYSAYCSIESFYLSGQGNNTESTLSDAPAELEKLKEYPKADASEVSTLYGYYYATLVASNPGENGRKYYSQVITFYKKAMELNPQNPRPVYLNAMFCQYIPESIRPPMNIEEEKIKAEALFAEEKPSTIKPHWGSFYLDHINPSK